MHTTELYEHDFNAWLAQQITLLQQGRMAELDTHHLITELEDMGKSHPCARFKSTFDLVPDSFQ